MSISSIHTNTRTHSHIHKLKELTEQCSLKVYQICLYFSVLFSFIFVKVQPCHTKFIHNWLSHLLAVTETWLSQKDTAFPLSLEWKLFLPTLLFDLARLLPPFSFQPPCSFDVHTISLCLHLHQNSSPSRLLRSWFLSFPLSLVNHQFLLPYGTIPCNLQICCDVIHLKKKLFDSTPLPTTTQYFGFPLWQLSSFLYLLSLLS